MSLPLCQSTGWSPSPHMLLILPCPCLFLVLLPHILLVHSSVMPLPSWSISQQLTGLSFSFYLESMAFIWHLPLAVEVTALEIEDFNQNLPVVLKYLQSNHEHWWPNVALEVNSKAKSACKKEGIEWAAWGKDKGGKTNEVRAFIKVESILVLSSVSLNLSSRNSKTQ